MSWWPCELVVFGLLRTNIWVNLGLVEVLDDVLDGLDRPVPVNRQFW